MKMFALLLIVCSWSTNVVSYNFICNSYDADGKQASDSCGPCNDATAGRWIPGDVSIYLDETTVPSGIGRTEWSIIFSTSIGSWNNTPDANIKMHQAGIAKDRLVGSDNAHHEVFWILDRAEWQKKIGSGVNETLGVTVAPYTCASTSGRSREIFDADLVMNGASTDFRWRPSCSSHYNCDSVISTVTHEFGHFIGLGHPTGSFRSDTIMSAKSGYQVERPLFDDQNGVRALYPAENSGKMGSPCEKSSDCRSKQCIAQKDAHFCSQPCSAQSVCPSGFSCAENEAGIQMCVFSSGRFAGAMGIGDSCVDKLCETNLICAGRDAENVFCFKPCSNIESCASGDICIPLERMENQGVCMHIASLDEDCGHESPCNKSLLCVVDGENQGKCRAPCDLNKNVNQCGIGAKCYDLGQGKGACIGKSTDEDVTKKPIVPTNSSSCDCASSLPVLFNGSWAGVLSVILLAAWFMGRRVSGFLS